MSEYWLISAPGDKTCQQTFDTMNNLTSKQNNLCNNFKFHIPDLKVGTLDQLVGLSDDLGKLDTYVEQITRKVAAYLGEVLEDQRDKLHENLLANNSPGPPDDCCTTTTHATTTPSTTIHSDLTGKSSNLSNSHDTTTTTTTTTSCSVCPSGSCMNFSSNEESDRDFDILSTASPPTCPCDFAGDDMASMGATSPTTVANDNCTLSSGNSVMNLRTINPFQPPTTRQRHFGLTSPLRKESGTSASSSFNISTAITAANTCATGPVTTANSLYFCSSSAPTGGAGGLTARSLFNKLTSSHHNNNTCSINNNSTSTTTTTLCSLTNQKTTPSTPTHHNNSSGSSTSRGFAGFFCGNHSRSTSKMDVNESHQYHQQQQHQQHHNLNKQQEHQQQSHSHNNHSHHQQQHHSHSHQHHHHDPQDQHYGGLADNNQHKHLKSSDSLSDDVSDTFEWWFQRHKRNSTKKSRSSPVSSCCGSSSHGRSSPDIDMGEPPAMPLSPADLPNYITRFQWDMAKYPIKQSLRNIADIISKQVGQIDADLKTKSNAYNNLKGSLQNLEKKQTGSLLTRNLADLVKKEHFILDSEYLTTLLVIVPKMLANDWMANYEKITDMIVPRSSTLITQDNDYCLYNVTLFKKVVEEFKLHAREKKFIVRDFVYNEEELAAGKNERTKLITDKKKQFGPLVRWLKVNFSEAFCALIHVKALRVFVESVLRYGLPVNFQAILIEPNKKSIKRLRDCLNQLYGHLDGASAGGQLSGSGADNVDIPGLGFGQAEYFPYVFYKINIDMVEAAKM
ncbi:V-type proton ATPase subunit C isoform X2 [Musca domestica]|uniref:V-type proton ATPase subunit C isoform X2 n=1 Tax=Musca domestica TaxID=7370 RepID=A0ABM3VM14_MUSDO|nr:V-type proton ATPase subunit C isoform X2 [Musca domestica]